MAVIFLSSPSTTCRTRCADSRWGRRFHRRRSSRARSSRSSEASPSSASSARTRAARRGVRRTVATRGSPAAVPGPAPPPDGGPAPGDAAEMVLEASALEFPSDPDRSVPPGRRRRLPLPRGPLPRPGGMGELYEAEDLELHERVALKTILSATGQDERSVMHVQARGAPGPAGDPPQRVPDLRRVPPPAAGLRPRATEGPRTSSSSPWSSCTARPWPIVSGGTGRLSTTDALVLARQMASALAAAHRVGVVHRDFKTENVMLVEAAAPGEDVARRRHGLRPGQAQRTGRSLQRVHSASTTTARSPALPPTWRRSRSRRAGDAGH